MQCSQEGSDRGRWWLTHQTHLPADLYSPVFSVLVFFETTFGLP